MKRYACIGKARPDMVDKYVRLHADTWPAVLDCNTACNLRNFSIYLKKLPNGDHWLFLYVEHIGEDFDADMQRMAEDPEVQRWWSECKPCFESIDDLAPGEVWSPMQEVFHQA